GGWGERRRENTQPFGRSRGGRVGIRARAGSLASRFEPSAGTPFEPVGSTDTERVFCELLGRIAARGWRSLGDADPETLRAWFDELNAHGSMTTVGCDGHDLCVYSDRA